MARPGTNLAEADGGTSTPRATRRGRTASAVKSVPSRVGRSRVDTSPTGNLAASGANGVPAATTASNAMHPFGTAQNTPTAAYNFQTQRAIPSTDEVDRLVTDTVKGGKGGELQANVQLFHHQVYSM